MPGTKRQKPKLPRRPIPPPTKVHQKKSKGRKVKHPKVEERVWDGPEDGDLWY